MQLATLIAAVSEEKDAQADATITVLQAEVDALKSNLELYSSSVAKRDEIAAKISEYEASHAEKHTSE